MSRISEKLSRKLSLGIMLLAVPIFVGTLGLLFLQARYLIRKEAMERSNSILNTTVQQVRFFMSSIETSTKANAWLLEENFTPDAFETISQRVMELNPNILSFAVSTEPDVLPQYGHHFSVYTIRERNSIRSFRETEYEYYKKLWYKTALKVGKPCWVEPFGEHTEGTINHNEAVATYCRPLYSKEGRITGVISADFDFKYLAKVINDVEPPYKDAYFILIGSDGRYFIHPNSAKLFRKTIFTDADPHENADIIALGHEMNGERQGTMHVTLNNKTCHVCYQPVPGTDWTLALICPDSEVLTGFHLLTYAIMLVIFIGLLLILWISNKVVKQTTRPIKNLLYMTQEIGKGNYDETIPYSYHQDPIGQLQNSFAKMQESLHENMGNIQQATEKLRLSNDRHQNAIDLAESASKEKEAFIRSVSHQVRTPLNIIMGYASVLYESLKANRSTPEDQNEFEKENMAEISQTIKRNAFLLKRMVFMLYDSSEEQATEEKKSKREDELSCNEIARESISYIKTHHPGIRIRFNTTIPNSTFILTNKVYLEGTLRELLNNAAIHSDKKHIQMHVVKSEAKILFIVEDTGPGLPKNALYMIDKPFTKMDEMSEGLGLGLPLCKRHAVNLGGDLILDTSYQIGCRFILELPR